MKKLLTILFAVALGLNLSAQTACPPAQDANQDGVIGVDDLMDLLSHWGDTDFDFDGVYDSVDLCTDEGACNYLSNPTEACLYLDAIGACGGDCAEDTDGDGVCDDFGGPCQGQSTVTYQDYTYDLVAIGDQCWFAENLRNDHYANGDWIPQNLSWLQWAATTSGAVAVYGEGESCDNYSPDGDACDPTWSLNEYGRLYNWYAVDDERGLCPNGWHVPTDEDWMTLEMELGLSESEANSTGSRGTDQGTQMKTTYGWADGGNGTNSSGFSGLPGGYRSGNGYFDVIAGQQGIWWSSSGYTYSAWYRNLVYDDSGVNRGLTNVLNGCSVRCLKDSE